MDSVTVNNRPPERACIESNLVLFAHRVKITRCRNLEELSIDPSRWTTRSSIILIFFLPLQDTMSKPQAQSMEPQIIGPSIDFARRKCVCNWENCEEIHKSMAFDPRLVGHPWAGDFCRYAHYPKHGIKNRAARYNIATLSMVKLLRECLIAQFGHSVLDLLAVLCIGNLGRAAVLSWSLRSPRPCYSLYLQIISRLLPDN